MYLLFLWGGTYGFGRGKSITRAVWLFWALKWQRAQRVPLCAIMTRKFIFWKIPIWISKKPRILCWFEIHWFRLKQMPLKKLEPKNYANLEYFCFCAFFRGVLLLTFVRGIFERQHQRIWNQLKILRFFIPILIVFKKKHFWVIIALFAILKCKCEKTVHFQTFCKK